MPWGYLVTVALVTVCTLIALTPVREPPRLGRLSWALAMIPNELPFVVGAYLVAATLFAGLQGDLDTSVGRIALGIAMIAAVCLAIIVARALRTARVVENALLDGLGTRVSRRRLPVLPILLAPFTVTRHDVQRIADLPYGDAGAQNTLDLYIGRDRAPTGPVLVYFHGGGFRTGKKDREARPLVYRLASEGWLCVSANYRLAPATFSDRMADARNVIEWARTRVREHGIDEPDVFVAGSSAGGHMALTAASTEPSISGAISLYAYYGPAEGNSHDTSPVAHARSSTAPLFVAHGDNDTFVPVEAAREFVDAVRKVSQGPVAYAELPGGQHSFDLFHSIRFERVVDGVEAFASWARARDAAGCER